MHPAPIEPPVAPRRAKPRVAIAAAVAIAGSTGPYAWRALYHEEIPAVRPVTGYHVSDSVNNSIELGSREWPRTGKAAPARPGDSRNVLSETLSEVSRSAAPEGPSHEPEGYCVFAELDGSIIPPYPAGPVATSGAWYAYPAHNPRLAIVTDRSAPKSPESVLSTTFPKGFRGGSGPVNFGGWDVKGSGPDGQKARVYLSVWIKIQGHDFENQLVGTKAGFIGVGMAPRVGNNQLVMHLNNGTGAQAIQSRIAVDFKIQGIPQPNGTVNRVMYQNVDRRWLMTSGVWHRWELLLILNNMGRADGQLSWWIDGTKVLYYRDVTFVTPSTPNGFYFYKWNPTWGGRGGQRTRSDVILLDHIYLSGVPLAGHDSSSACPSR
jgi:hypothetical protein